MHGIKGLFKDNSFRVLIGVFAVFLILPLFFTEAPQVSYGSSYHEGQLMDSDTQDTTAGNIFSRGFSNYFKRLQKFYLGKGYTQSGAEKKKTINLSGLDNGDETSSLALPEGAAGEVRNAPESVTLGEGASSGAGANAAAGGEFGLSSGASGVVYRTRKDENGQEYIEMDDGKMLAIGKDKKGNRFAILDGGTAVPFKTFADSFVSEEEFAAARKAAPNLSTSELLVAAKSDGGVKGYLSNVKQLGREAAFEKAQADLEAKFSKAMGAGGGAVSAGGFNGSFDGSGNATATGAAAAQGLSAIGDKYQQKINNVATQTAGKSGGVQRMVDTTGLFANIGEPSMAGSQEVGVEIVRSRGGDSYDAKINVSEKGSIIPKSDTFREDMAKALGLKESDFSKRTKTGGDDKNLEKYPVTIPVGQMDNPVKKFLDDNRDFLSKKGEDYNQAVQDYKDARKVITDNQANLKGKQYQVIAIDGNVNGKTILQGEDSLAYQTVSGLFSGKVKPMAADGVVQKDSQLNEMVLSNTIPENKKKEIIFVVKDKKQAEELNKKGWNAVYIYLPTPTEFNSVTNQTEKIVKKDLNSEKAAAKTNAEMMKQLRTAMPKGPKVE